MGVGSKDSVPAGFPKKNSGLAPEGLSIRTGTGAGHRPLWCPTMALKIKILRGARGLPLVLLFPLSLCKEGGCAGQTRFCRACWSLSAHIKRCPNEKGYPMRGHVPFSAWRKDAKRRLGGAPLSTPDGRPVFFSGKPAGTLTLEPTLYKEGARGPRGV